jgi:hypothetical protein
VSATKDRALSARSRAFSKTLEAVAWAAGIVCLAYVGVRHLDSVNSNRESMRRFTELRRRTSPWRIRRCVALVGSADRGVAAHTGSAGPTPLAILRIPRIHLEVPVLEGTDELTLNRAVGHIEDTAAPGADGNAASLDIATVFFRGLMNVVPEMRFSSNHLTGLTTTGSSGRGSSPR